jgi:gamma-glutamyltranspeptidase/glutathione hydrolase
MALNILEGYDLAGMEHNGAEYIHLVAAALDLAFADRYQYIGDPKFVDVPIDGLMSKEYAKIRRTLIDKGKAWGKMPPPGDPRNMKAVARIAKEPTVLHEDAAALDTSYGCVVDREGNAFSTTPSDSGPLLPGLGIVVSPRGCQAWLDPALPSSVQPGKRPHLTPNPALAFKDGKLFMAYGAPGGDAQPQAMVQVLVNVVDFDMNIQQAIEAPRLKSENFPNSFSPHVYNPGRLNVEARVPQKVLQSLREMGHDVNAYSEWARSCGSVCAIVVDRERCLFMGGADPRRECYAIGY